MQEEPGVPERKQKSLCPVSKKCGGCQLLDMPYSQQLTLKKKQLEETLKGICKVQTVIGMEQPFHYRNKVHAVFDRDRRGNIISRDLSGKYPYRSACGKMPDRG